MDVIEDTIVNEWNYFVLLLFLGNLTVSFDCLTLQDKDNIHIVGKYKKRENLHQLQNRPKPRFLHVSKVRTNKLYIFRQCMYNLFKWFNLDCT